MGAAEQAEVSEAKTGERQKMELLAGPDLSGDEYEVLREALARCKEADSDKERRTQLQKHVQASTGVTVASTVMWTALASGLAAFMEFMLFVPIYGVVAVSAIAYSYLKRSRTFEQVEKDGVVLWKDQSWRARVSSVSEHLLGPAWIASRYIRDWREQSIEAEFEGSSSDVKIRTSDVVKDERYSLLRWIDRQLTEIPQLLKQPNRWFLFQEHGFLELDNSHKQHIADVRKYLKKLQRMIDLCRDLLEHEGPLGTVHSPVLGDHGEMPDNLDQAEEQFKEMDNELRRMIQRSEMISANNEMRRLPTEELG